MRRLGFRLLAVAMTVALASAPDARAEKTALPDSSITNAVTYEFSADHAVPAPRIDVTTDDGIVSLTGTVDNLLAKERAVRLAETVRGVRSVVDRVTVKPPRPRADEAVRDDVVAALLMDPAADSYEIGVDVEDGHVTLTGTVQSWKERELSETVARSVRGVTGVTDEIRVDYGADRPDLEIQTDIAEALRWNSLVDHELIQVSVEDGAVRLTGLAGTAAEKRRARLEAWTQGVKSVDDSNLRVARWSRDENLREPDKLALTAGEIREAVEDALARDPRVYSFNVTPAVATGTVTLRGTVDNLEAKRAAESTARNTVGVLAVDNLLRVEPEHVATDTAIEAQIRASFERDPLVWALNVGIRVEDGTVHLTGTVDTQYESARADAIAGRVPGVTEVVNRIKVRNYAKTFNPHVDSWWYDSMAGRPLLENLTDGTALN
ncbi:MAG: BON domain-containing protein [Gemmatimonadetes bacterium]|nr:BON domain-containing protein [Gemmatimonadota bacterium]